MKIDVVSVNVALPSVLGMHRGHTVTSAMAKQAVRADTVWLGDTNLEGDAQADLTQHGGPDKAVYAYPSEHLPAWSAELGQTLGPGAFGENVTTAGATEEDVCIGDRWLWGDAVLEVSQPRSPCFKLAIHRSTGDIGRRMRDSGRCGWYLRVLREGVVPVAGPIDVQRHRMGATVAVVHAAARPGDSVPPEVVEALVLVEPMADEWRTKLAARLWAADAGR